MASAANRTITGVVISGEDNEPLIGASVYVHTDELKKAGASQTSLGTITDIDGKFSLSVPMFRPLPGNFCQFQFNAFTAKKQQPGLCCPGRTSE